MQIHTLFTAFHSKKARISFAFPGFFLIIILLFTWLSSHIFSENARFEKFAESIFEKEVSGNALNLH